MKIAEVKAENITQLSEELKEPSWYKEERLKAWNRYLELPVETNLLYAKYVNKKDLEISEYEVLEKEENRELEQQILEGLDKETIEHPILITSLGKPIFTFIPEDAKGKVQFLSREEWMIKDGAEQHLGSLFEKYQKNKFAMLNIALAKELVVIYVPKNTQLKKEIIHLELLDHMENQINISHTIVHLEENSSATVIREMFSAQTSSVSVNTALNEFILGAGASLKLGELQNMSKNVLNIVNNRGFLQRDSIIHYLDTQLGSKTTFLTERFHLEDQGANVFTYKCIFGEEEQILDYTSTVNHIGANTVGHSYARIVVKDKAKVNFKGMVRIEESGVNTDSNLVENSLILSKDAQTNTIPALEIITNEVKASHAATVSQLDEDQIFYTMTRGIPRKDAERLLVRGYFEPILARHPSKFVQEVMRIAIEQKWDQALTEAITTSFFKRQIEEQEIIF